MKSRWRPVVGYEGFYEVSDLGEVRSLPRCVYSKWVGKRRLQKPIPGVLLVPGVDNKKGHLRVKLYSNGKRTRQQVHRVVLSAFVGPCPTGMEARHLDGDPSNNSLKNLCWGTAIENWRDRYDHGTAVSITFRTNTSGHRGVSWAKNLSKWHAYIGLNPRTNLGWFPTFEEACSARVAAEKDWRGSRRIS